MTPFSLGPKLTKLSATTTSSSAQMRQGGSTILVKNEGPNAIFIATGDGSVTAVLDESMPVFSGSVESFAIPEKHTHVAAITRTSTATVYVVRGYGN